MTPMEYVKGVHEDLHKKFTYACNDVTRLEAELEQALAKCKEIDDLLEEFEDFIEKNERAEDADSGRDQGVLVEPVTEDVRLPGTES